MSSLEIPFLPKGRLPHSEESTRDEDTVDSAADTFSIHKHGRRQGRLDSAAARAITILLALWGLGSLPIQLFHLIRPPAASHDVYRPETLTPDLNLCDCGRTIDEAIARKCVYDSLATAWLPPHCRDDALTAEFDRSGPGSDGSWPYYADANGTIPIGKAQIALLGDGQRSFWSLREWHIAHCLFYWEKLVRMRETGAVMERRFDTANHARHCRRLVMNPSMFHKQLVEVPVMMSSGTEEVMNGHEHEHGHREEIEGR
ncbi:uncharacterized protein DSM5745_05080 [Aspergillus mulundensis]|uniref:Uncharacterized protein n=1 Tax=Aspergillus mulundensis TaxID=1810919 RepID=A0A3D8S5E1_9EURO|nr:hypothetical protein DSM5745_05080 [Aspergillus mulundensis]RDW81523.1 hypothetical protein DSM5745_05080 [Aspergillus mulundensis]